MYSLSVAAPVVSLNISMENVSILDNCFRTYSGLSPGGVKSMQVIGHAVFNEARK